MQDEGTAREQDDGPGAASGDAPFGAHRATRFGADVHYEGRREDHDYIAQVRHRFLDTEVVVFIDGVRHDPAAEKVLGKKTSAEDVTTQDGIALKLDEGLFRHRLTVRRPTVKGEMKDRESIVVRTTLLGGAGEVDVVRNEELRGQPLVPAEGSPSAAREARKAEHPVRYGLLAAGSQAARYLLPLLGLGALLSGLLEPVERWIGERVRPILTWLDEATRGIRAWIGEVTRPLRELLEAVVDPVRRFVGWLWELLFGWIPDIHLGLDIADWIIDYLVPVLVVVVVFVATFGTIRDRRARMERARREREAEPGEEPAGGPGERAEGERDGSAGSGSSSAGVPGSPSAP